MCFVVRGPQLDASRQFTHVHSYKVFTFVACRVWFVAYELHLGYCSDDDRQKETRADFLRVLEKPGVVDVVVCEYCIIKYILLCFIHT